MDEKDSLFFKMPYCARASTRLYGIYMIPCLDCEIKRKLEDKVSFLNEGEKFSEHEIICFKECTHEFERRWLTEEEIRYLTQIGREKKIKGLRPEEEMLYAAPLQVVK